MLAKPFEEKYLEKYNFVVYNLDKESTWDKYGNNSIKDLAEEDSLNQIPGDDYKDFFCSVSSEPKHDGRLVFLPFRMVYYEYDGQHNYAIMDGSGNYGIIGTTPVDQDRVKEVEKWHTISKYVKWAAIASILVIFLNWDLLFIPIIMWLAFGGLKIFANINENRIIKKNRKIREQKVAELKGS